MRTRLVHFLPLLLLLGCIKLPFGQGVESFKEHSFGPSKGKVKAKVAVVDVRGTMTSRTSSQGLGGKTENIVARTKEQLDRAGRDRAVKAVVVRISSPGGAVYPSLAIYRELRSFKKRFDKPIIAYTPDIAASGGYLAALGTDGIMADEAALVGSIGVIATMPNVSGLLSMIRVEMNTFKTGDLKDVGSPFRKMRDKDKSEVEGLLNHYFDLFKNVVAKERRLSEDSVAELATGAVFPAARAREIKLIDWVGDVHDAHARAAKLAGLTRKSTRLIIYRRPHEYHRSIYSPPSAEAETNLATAITQLLGQSGMKLHYLWSPG